MTPLCRLCRHRPAVLPDRTTTGRPLKRVCRECHQGRLAEDVEDIMAMAAYSVSTPRWTAPRVAMETRTLWGQTWPTE